MVYNKHNWFWEVIFLTFVFSFGAGFVVGNLNRFMLFRRDAIKHGYAEYDSKTGDWQWKDGIDYVAPKAPK